MTTNVERMQRTMLGLGVACLGLVPLGSRSGQEPKNAAEPPKEDAGTDVKKLAQARADAARMAYGVAVELWKQRQSGVKSE
jgi:hypothetical protein